MQNEDEAQAAQVKRLTSGVPSPDIQIQIDHIMARLSSEYPPIPTLEQVGALTARLNYLEKRRHHEVIEEREERIRQTIADSVDRWLSAQRIPEASA